MVQIKWNGRDAEDALNRAAFPQIRGNMEKALREARCPDHGSRPTRVEAIGNDLKSLQWRVYGCCPEKLLEAGLSRFR
jgi:hypothetical protein